MTEETLSDKILKDYYVPVLEVEDVKNFIKRLKEFLLNRLYWTGNTMIDYDNITNEVDKLAGNDLI